MNLDFPKKLKVNSSARDAQVYNGTFHRRVTNIGKFGNYNRCSKWLLYNGDALAMSKLIPADYVNCVVTSPPYFWLRDYQVNNQYGLEDTVQEYVENIVNSMSEVYRTLRSDGLLFLNLSDTYYSGKGRSHGNDPKNSKRKFGMRVVDASGGLGIGMSKKSLINIPHRVAIALTEAGWILRNTIIWVKSPWGRTWNDRPRNSYEFIFMFAKNRKYYFSHAGLQGEEDVWFIKNRPKSTNGISTAPFPDEVVERCLAIGCPDKGIVFDPFAGSGTTLRVALESGRRAIGIELNPKFCNYIRKTLK